MAKKLVVVGPKDSNKTDLLVAFEKKNMPQSDYVCTVFDNFRITFTVDGNEATLALFDISGQEDYDRLRPLRYTFTDVFLVCFSLDSQASLESACEDWIPEIKYHCPGVPYLLVGTNSEHKFEVYLDKSMLERRNEMIKKSGAWSYLECSASTMEGVNEIFENSIRAATQSKASVSANSSKWYHKLFGRRAHEQETEAKVKQACPLSLKTLHLIKWKDGRNQKHKFRLVDKVSSKWQDTGILLGITLNTLEGWKRESLGNATLIWDKVMSYWLDGRSESYRVSWNDLNTLLIDVELSEVVTELEVAMKNYES